MPPEQETTEQVLEEIDKKLDEQRKETPPPPPPPAPAPTADPVEEVAKKTGWTKEQAREHVILEQTQSAWDQVSKAHPDMDKYKDLMNKELSSYPPEVRRNPVLLEKVFYLAKGISLEKEAKNAPPRNDSTPPPARRISQPFPGREGGQGGSSDTPAPKLTDEEKIYAKRLGISEEDYERSKGKRNIRDVNVSTRETGGNTADVALRNLTKRR